jgi:hypothetical protein
MDSLHYSDLRKSKAVADSLQKTGYTVTGCDLDWHNDASTPALANTADDMCGK